MTEVGTSVSLPTDTSQEKDDQPNTEPPATTSVSSGSPGGPTLPFLDGLYEEIGRRILLQSVSNLNKSSIFREGVMCEFCYFNYELKSGVSSFQTINVKMNYVRLESPK